MVSVKRIGGRRSGFDVHFSRRGSWKAEAKVVEAARIWSFPRQKVRLARVSWTREGIGVAVDANSEMARRRQEFEFGRQRANRGADKGDL